MTTVTAKVLLESKFIDTANAGLYTADAVRAIIDKATVTNTAATDTMLWVNLVGAALSPGDENLAIQGRSLAPGETYACPELVGHAIEASGAVWAKASSPNSLSMRLSGREISD